MRIGGLQKCSLIDYPGKISCVIFTQGCNFRCPYCHNRELVLPEFFKKPIPESDVLAFLRKRQQYLNGVVVTGGEPTDQEDLLDFIQKVKGMGYPLKLDTNGSRPHIIRKIISKSLVDYIAMDVKTSMEKYSKAIGVNFPVELIKDSSITHEFRTTVVQPFCKYEDVCRISSLFHGEKSCRLQSFRESSKMINPNIQEVNQFSNEEIELWKEKL